MIHKQHTTRVIGIVISLVFLFTFTGCSTISKLTSWWGGPDKAVNSDPLTQDQINSFAKTIKPVHGDAAYHYDLARNFQKKDRHEIAIEELYKALKINPGDYNAYNALGVSYDNLKAYDLAIDAYQRALKLNPDLDYVYNNMGFSCLLKGDLDAAVVNFNKAIALRPDRETYQNNLRLAMARQGKTEYIADIPVHKPDNNEIAIQRTVPQEPVKETAVIHEEKIAESDKPLTEKESVVQEKTVTERFLALQLGAFTDLDRAVRLLNKAQKKGYDCPYIIKVERPEPYKPYYRVRAGKFVNQTEAGAFASQIAGSHAEPPLIVSEVYPLKVYHAKEKAVCSDDVIVENKRPFKKNSIEVLNGNGINRMARRVSLYFENSGLAYLKPANANHFNYQKTRIYYAPGFYNEALKVARQLPGVKETAIAESSELNAQLRVILGKDIIPFNRDLRKQLNI